MKKHVTILLSFGILFSSCSIFKKQSGCPASRQRVGAEEIISGNPKAIRKATKSASRYSNIRN